MTSYSGLFPFQVVDKQLIWEHDAMYSTEGVPACFQTQVQAFVHS